MDQDAMRHGPQTPTALHGRALPQRTHLKASLNSKACSSPGFGAPDQRVTAISRGRRRANEAVRTGQRQRWSLADGLTGALSPRRVARLAISYMADWLRRGRVFA